MWRRYAEMGLLGLAIDEEHGGSGMGIDELCVVMEAFGRALVLEPFLSCVVLGGGLVSATAHPAQRSDWLPRIAAGDILIAVATTESRSRWSLVDIDSCAVRDGARWRVSGQKITVAGGDSADLVLMSALTPDGGLGLFAVEGTAVGRNAYQMHDGTRGADLLFSDAPAVELGPLPGALAALEDVIDRAIAVLCAESVGIMEGALALTVEHLKSRRQFGKSLSTLQALQHRAADMYVSLEQARSMALLARLAVAAPHAPERRSAILAAKIQVDMSGRHITHEAVQLHGGIGMTMEYPVGHYLRRMTAIRKTVGDVDTILGALADRGGLIGHP
jgi:alkylation response protein AidB-like acyl-CoA dehydrogenase